MILMGFIINFLWFLQTYFDLQRNFDWLVKLAILKNYKLPIFMIGLLFHELLICIHKHLFEYL